jgi:hypothetical protein
VRTPEELRALAEEQADLPEPGVIAIARRFLNDDVVFLDWWQVAPVTFETEYGQQSGRALAALVVGYQDRIDALAAALREAADEIERLDALSRGLLKEKVAYMQAHPEEYPLLFVEGDPA